MIKIEETKMHPFGRGVIYVTMPFLLLQLVKNVKKKNCERFFFFTFHNPKQNKLTSKNWSSTNIHASTNRRTKPNPHDPKFRVSLFSSNPPKTHNASNTQENSFPLFFWLSEIIKSNSYISKRKSFYQSQIPQS